MSEAELLPEHLLEAGARQLTKIESALGHIARAIDLELIDSVLSEELTEQASDQLQTLSGALLRISEVALDVRARIPEAIVNHDDSVLASAASAESFGTLSIGSSEEEALKQPTVLESAETSSHTRSSERSHLIDEPDLYAGILQKDQIPLHHLLESESIGEIKIVGESAIVVKDRRVDLKPHEIFIFNALLQSRAHATKGAKIRPWAPSLIYRLAF